MEPQHEQKNNRKAGPQETGAHDIRLVGRVLGLSQSVGITIADLKLSCGIARLTPRGGQATSVRGTGEAPAFPCLSDERVQVPAGHRRHLCGHVEWVCKDRRTDRRLSQSKDKSCGLEGDGKLRS